MELLTFHMYICIHAFARQTIADFMLSYMLLEFLPLLPSDVLHSGYMYIFTIYYSRSNLLKVVVYYVSEPFAILYIQAAKVLS